MKDIKDMEYIANILNAVLRSYLSKLQVARNKSFAHNLMCSYKVHLISCHDDVHAHVYF